MIPAYEPLVRIIGWIDGIAFGLALLLILAACMLRIAQQKRLRRERAFLAVWRPLLLDALDASLPPRLPALAADERVPFLKLWSDLMRDAGGEAAHNLIDVARAIGCDRFARHLLRHGSRAECLLATVALGHLCDQVAREALTTQTLAADNITSLHAFHALVRIDADTTAAELTPLMLARTDWPVAQVAAILQTAQHAFAPALLAAVTEHAAEHLPRTLRLLEALHLSPPPAALAALLARDDTETVAAALRTIHDREMLPQVRPLLRHADWRVRLQAAKAIGRLGEEADANRLVPLLADAEWWVRYRTAQALVGMPSFGRAEAEMLRDHLTDRFARDMLAQALAEKDAA